MWGWRIVFFWLLFAAAPLRAARVEVPPLTAPVLDVAGMLDPTLAAKLNNALRELWQKGGSQIAILTLPELGGETIEQVSIRVADVWQLGEKAQDNGILLIIAKAERRIRIEVGQGREGDLPDAYAKRIVDEAISPLFKVGDINGGILVGVQQVLARTDPNFSLERYLALPRSPSGHQRSTDLDPVTFLFIALIVFFLFFRGSGPRGRRRRSVLGSGGFSRGGGFSGGGGYSGRGGGFSGGGASGSW